MSNVHIQTAASNLRRASDDFKVSMDKVKSDANDQKREMEKQIDKLKQQQNVLQVKARSSGDEPGKAEALLLSAGLNNEISQLEKSVYDSQDQARKQVDQINSQINDLNNLAGKLENSA
ncbi:MAG: hypothetical protein M3Q36_00135 [bacterium]|nr:hypothetical protein [bacterium]